jgi:hypothetical protein
MVRIPAKHTFLSTLHDYDFQGVSILLHIDHSKHKTVESMKIVLKPMLFDMLGRLMIFGIVFMFLALTLQSTVSTLVRRQHSRAIEVKGIPFTEDEDVIKTVDLIAKKLSCDVNINDLDNVYRIGKSDLLVVSFTTKLKQREFLTAGRTNTLNLNDNANNNIYINELVSKKSKFLLKMGRDLKRDKKLHWIGTHEGEVFCRKVFKGTKYKINEMEDFEHLLNSEY